MSASEVFFREFFESDRKPTNNHEEWLLKNFQRLMQREAQLISVQNQMNRAASNDEVDTRDLARHGGGDDGKSEKNLP